MTNSWHSVHFGPESPQIVNAIIEIPERSRAKYELDKQTGLLKLDRVLYSAVYYPANYGFIPQTLGEDRDPLDIMVVSKISVQPLCLLRAKVIGVMRMIDSEEEDDKIIAVAQDDMSMNHIEEMSQLPPHFISELTHFFEEYKRLENKKVSVEGFQDQQTAFKIIGKSIENYQRKFGSKSHED